MNKSTHIESMRNALQSCLGVDSEIHIIKGDVSFYAGEGAMIFKDTLASTNLSVCIPLCRIKSLECSRNKLGNAIISVTLN